MMLSGSQDSITIELKRYDARYPKSVFKQSMSVLENENYEENKPTLVDFQSSQKLGQLIHYSTTKITQPQQLNSLHKSVSLVGADSSRAVTETEIFQYQQAQANWSKVHLT